MHETERFECHASLLANACIPSTEGRSLGDPMLKSLATSTQIFTMLQGRSGVQLQGSGAVDSAEKAASLRPGEC